MAAKFQIDQMEKYTAPATKIAGCEWRKVRHGLAADSHGNAVESVHFCNL